MAMIKNIFGEMHKNKCARVIIVSLCIVLIIIIFVIDTFSTWDIAIAVLYVIVVLLASMVSSKRYYVFITQALCSFLTLLGFLVSHGPNLESASFGRCLVSISAIGITAFLASRNQSINQSLKDHLTLISNTHDAIIVCNLEGQIQSWSLGAERLYGWKEKDVTGQDVKTLLKVRSDPDISTLITHLLDTKEQWEGELIETCNDGSEIIVKSRWSLWIDNGKPIAIIAANNDITDAKKAEDDLFETKAQLAHITRITTLGELAASIAHEVNQPLAAIAANGSACQRWIDRDVPDLIEAKLAISRIRADANRAHKIISRLRRLSCKAESTTTDADIIALLNDTLNIMHGELRKNKIKIIKSYSTIPFVRCDPIQIQQVIINLFINAIHAISSNEQSSRELLITVIPRDQHDILVSIKDSGPGITSEKLDVIFNPFFTTKPDGMGMGLSICRSIVEAHRGRIWVDTSSMGATFSFSLNVSESSSD
jgi:PAS domain S-box-containing protein